MSRKGPSKKHVVLPDPIYGSTVVAQLINKILLDGKKSDRKSTRLNSSHSAKSRMPSSA